jgi:hypothetical protein
MVYRLFDFFSSLFIIMLVGNYFAIKVLDRKLFWREIEHRIEEEIWEGEVHKAEKEQEERRKRLKEERKTLLKKSTHVAVVRYAGHFEIRLPEASLDHLDDPASKSLIKGLFDEIAGCDRVARLNRRLILVLRGCYLFLTVMTVSDVTFMWALPFTYAFSLWVEILLQSFIFLGIGYGTFKMERYYEKVRDLVKKYEKKKHLMISVRPRERKFEFLFLKSEKVRGPF